MFSDGRQSVRGVAPSPFPPKVTLTQSVSKRERKGATSSQERHSWGADTTHPGKRAGGGPKLRIVLFGVRDEGEGPITVKDRRLGTDRRRSRQRTVVVSDVSYATVYLVRNALAGIERATCSTERLAVRTASCGSRRERFAARRVGEHVSSDVSLCTSYQS